MTPLVSSTVLAVALITSPELPEDFQPDALTALAIREVSLATELMDPRELKYLLANWVEIAPDLKLIRKRYTELHDAPPACDASRFPNRELCSELIGLNRRYKTYLEDRIKLGPSLAGNEDVINEVIAECDRLYQIWDTVRDLKCDYYYVTVRRQSLKKLQEQIGEANYYGGFLPPHLPVWRFNRRD